MASTFGDKEKSLSQRYIPHVRVLELPNVTTNDIQKFDWKSVSQEDHIWSIWSEKYPDQTPEEVGLSPNAVQAWF